MKNVADTSVTISGILHSVLYVYMYMHSSVWARTWNLILFSLVIGMCRTALLCKDKSQYLLTCEADTAFWLCTTDLNYELILDKIHFRFAYERYKTDGHNI